MLVTEKNRRRIRISEGVDVRKRNGINGQKMEGEAEVTSKPNPNAIYVLLASRPRRSIILGNTAAHRTTIRDANIKVFVADRQ